MTRKAADVRLLVGEVSIPMGVEDPRHAFDSWISTHFKEQWDWLNTHLELLDIRVEYLKDFADFSMVYQVFVDMDEENALLYRLTFGNKIS